MKMAPSGQGNTRKALLASAALGKSILDTAPIPQGYNLPTAPTLVVIRAITKYAAEDTQYDIRPNTKAVMQQDNSMSTSKCTGAIMTL